jgi:catechol 2,3-dioxygenase-like lactoylglutathione lyase family enzyme
VHDIDSARVFYGEVLALEELERPPEIAAKFRSAWYRVGGSELHVVENADFEPLDSQLGPHVAVMTDDFDATVARIDASGTAFRFGPARGPDGVLRAVVADPTGNVFEITTAQPRA